MASHAGSRIASGSLRFSSPIAARSQCGVVGRPATGALSVAVRRAKRQVPHVRLADRAFALGSQTSARSPGLRQDRQQNPGPTPSTPAAASWRKMPTSPRR